MVEAAIEALYGEVITLSIYKRFHDEIKTSLKLCKMILLLCGGNLNTLLKIYKTGQILVYEHPHHHDSRSRSNKRALYEICVVAEYYILE